MQRYKPPMIFSTQKPAHMHPELDGDYVLHSEAQAEIERLQAEVERLTGERRMIVSHSTMGATDGSEMTVNGVSCEITKLRNDLYDEGITLAQTAHNDAILTAEKWVSDRYKTSNYSWYNEGMLTRALKK